MASSGDLFSGRGKKLYALFNNFLKGTSPVKNNQDAEHFLEATDMICRHKTPGIYVESVVSSARGIEVLSGVVRSDLGPSFLAKVMKLLVKHLADPLVKNMNNGGFLQSLLVAILHPPAFWSALLKHHQASGFALDDAETFAWLCLEIVSTKCPELETPFGDVVALMDRKALLQSTLHPVRQVAYRIEKVLSLHSVAAVVNVDHGPGGRHDNDFSDFRAISLFPTADEIRCKEIPFLQRFDDVFDGPRESRAADYLSWLFRLLREDMLAEMREDLAVAWGQKTARRKPFWLGGLSLLGFGEDSGRRHDPLVLRLKCRDGIVFPRLVGRQSRKKFLEDSKSFMRHKATGVICRGDDIVAFGSVVRNIDLLLTQPPTILIKLADVGAMQKTIDSLLKEATCDELRFFVVNTATFAYEPILQRLKEIIEIPLEDALLQPESATTRDEPPASLAPLLRKLERGLEEAKEVDLTSIAKVGKPVRISGAQLECLINGLQSRVGQIQGPPGTGKSFIGALILIIILNFTDYRVLVLSYTNHALDQFLEELMDFGVSTNDIVRLGSKSTPKTDALRLDNQFKNKEYRFSIGVHAMIKKLKAQDADVKGKLAAVGAKLAAAGIDPEDLLAMLELSGDDGPLFWTAFQVPIQEDGFRVVGKNNKPMEPGEILDIWIRGDTSPTVQALVDMMDPQCHRIWEMPVSSRSDLVAQWCSKLRRDQMDEYCDLARLATKIQQQIDSLFDETKRKVFRSKRVIGCTTTAAAMYQSILASAEPDLVLVEEAGEILEAHIVTALGPSVKKLVLIGDHKQLRPKVNSYDLTVEKGDGYNLNVSLFERLIQQGHAYTTLREQHRSHPDISHFTRRLAYEHLQDHPKTSERQKIRGLKGRVIFVHHEHQEDKLSDGGESARGESKKNLFEAKMVLKTVRYLGQQGYKSKNMVVLTPYLGQLSLLKSQLSTTHDPWLDDLDSNNLVQAGLMTEATAQLNKEPLRLSTIDNYQGEESDIVIASLTRSNDSGDIGFMAARERLVVLVSRAREGIVLFGNMNTFIKSKKGGPLWLDFFQALKEKVKDHSKVPCHVKIQKTCERGHKSNVICSATDEGCGQCAREDEKTRRRAAQDLELETLRHERQAAYARQLDKIDDDIDHCERVMAYESEDERQRKQIEDKKAKLKGLQETQKRRRVAESLKKEQLPAKQSMEGSAKDSSSRSPAQQEWEAIRSPGDLVNDALDKLMDLIGLESVKEEFLAVKSNIDTKIRQGVSLSEERLSCSLLGNPGTGRY
ncbi:hypothetical protein UVI_02049720 [Ustilaginoidea virens]|uniref:Uncharacterized protein n=1 Tax=Ustilaginoidea virens TaxID=1159556 RepID=A0A1B5L098_USTVR|nr:hypothetical protein UVI_02049720 [Ustilaginoidea virens]